MEKFTKILETIDGYVWGIPLIVLIMAVGIFLTFRLRLLQIFHLPKALKFMFQNENGGKGEISSFAALCTALSATIGTGNIVGVATAIGVLSTLCKRAGQGFCSGCGFRRFSEWRQSIPRVFLLSNTDVWTLTDTFAVDHSIT